MFDQENIPFLHVPCYAQDLSPIWEKALAYGQRMSFKKGECFNLNESGNCFGYIKSGITCHRIIDYYSLKDEIRFFIGRRSLIKDTFVSAGYGYFQSSHTCLTDVVIYRFNKNILYDLDFLQKYPDLLQNYIFSISAKSVSAQFFISILKRSSNEQKVAIFIYGFYLLNKARLSFTPPFSQLYLAELLGLSKLTINRVIGRFKDMKIITNYTKKNITILDTEKLRELRGQV